MKMNVSTAFNRAACGTMSTQSAQEYDHFLREYYNGLASQGGWVSELIDKVMGEHTTFMHSRMWEYGRMGKADVGFYVGPYEIGYLRTPYAQQNAKGLMCSVIMANPLVSDYYAEGRLHGYDDALHRFCTGTGEENYFYRKVTDSILTTGGGATPTEYKRYLSTRDSLTTLTENEREDAMRTWRHVEHNMKNGFDPTSPKGEPIKTVEEAAMKKRDEGNEIIH